jgi:hypothetical protein
MLLQPAILACKQLQPLQGALPATLSLLDCIAAAAL